MFSCSKHSLNSFTAVGSTYPSFLDMLFKSLNAFRLLLQLDLLSLNDFSKQRAYFFVINPNHHPIAIPANYFWHSSGYSVGDHPKILLSSILPRKFLCAQAKHFRCIKAHWSRLDNRIADDQFRRQYAPRIRVNLGCGKWTVPKLPHARISIDIQRTCWLISLYPNAARWH